MDGYGFYNITITINLNRPPNTPSAPSGEFAGYTWIRYIYSTSTTDPDGDSVRYQFDWGDGTRDTTEWHASGETASAGHHWTSSGTYKVKACAQDPGGLWSGWSSKHTVYIEPHPDPGCPILSVYDGTQYALEGLLDIHNPDGTDVITDRVLTVTPSPVEHRYLMRLTEHNQTHSHIDQVQLHATLKNGTEIKLQLVSAVHSADGDVLQELLLSDDVRADTLGADRNNGTSELIDLEFVAPEGLEIQRFTFTIEGYNIWEK